MNYELNFENDTPQVLFENTTNDIQFQAPQNVVGGTTNYNGLSNKPKINNVELIGNKTLEDLGIKQEYTASDIKFADGDTFQDKYNSGELNGKDGYTPIKNVDYFDGKDGSNGKDGVSCTHSWNGTTLTITSASGTTSANLKGETGLTGATGKDGYTPIKGKDYFDGVNGKNGIDGKDGYTPVKGIDYFDGKDGKNGVDGKTPVKGVDYYTEADKLEMVDLVLSALPSSEGVSY
jgi:hypothetical protein